MGRTVFVFATFALSFLLVTVLLVAAVLFVYVDRGLSMRTGSRRAHEEGEGDVWRGGGRGATITVCPRIVESFPKMLVASPLT